MYVKAQEFPPEHQEMFFFYYQNYWAAAQRLVGSLSLGIGKSHLDTALCSQP